MPHLSTDVLSGDACRQLVGAILMAISAYARHGDAALQIRREHYSEIAKLGLFNYFNSICFIITAPSEPDLL